VRITDTMIHTDMRCFRWNRVFMQCLPFS
jgi:hypothetical protein